MSNETITLNTYTSIAIALYFVISIIVLIVVWKLRVKSESPSKQIGFTIPSVKLIKKHKGVPDEESDTLILAYNYMCSESPVYDPHMDAFISLGFYSEAGDNIAKAKSVNTAMAAFYGNTIEDCLVQYDQLTANVYASLEKCFELSIPVISRELPITQTDIDSDYVATYLDEYSYTVIVSEYNACLHANEKIPHPTILLGRVQTNRLLVNDVTLHDVMSAISAYSSLFNQPVPRVYQIDDISVSNLIKCVKAVRTHFAFKDKKKQTEPVKPILQIVK